MPRVPETFDTERLTLKRPTRADAQLMFDRYASRDVVTKYLAWPTHRTLEPTHAFLANADDAWELEGVGPWLIWSKGGGALLGSTGLDLGDDDTVTTGYLLVPEAWGKGYATEVLRAVVSQARAAGFRSVSACVHPDNHASIHVLEKGGLRRGAACGELQLFPNLDATTRLPKLTYSLALRPEESSASPRVSQPVDGVDLTRFRSLEEAVFAAKEEFAPASGWTLTLPRFSRDGATLKLHGALPTTMHFGSMLIDLDRGDVVFIDQDHRDGGDFEDLRRTLPEPWLARLRQLAR